MYELKFDKKAIDFLNKAEKDLRERIWKKLQDFKQDPFRFVEHLEQIEGVKLRIGDYRVVVDIDKANQTINILKIGYRKNIYEN